MVILAGGPSLTAADVERCRGARQALQADASHPVRVIAVNDAYRLAPWADLLYFADARWWAWHKDKDEFKAFAGDKVTIENTGALVDDPGVFMLHNYGTTGMSLKRNGLMTGQNSGHQAVNLAVLLGASRILLLGFDMHAAGGKMHWFGDHPVKTNPSIFSAMLNNFTETIAPLKVAGVEVINCTPDSALHCYRKESLDEALRFEAARLEHDQGPTLL